jgi:hypothetical protein
MDCHNVVFLGVDTAGENTGKEFEVTFGEGVSALYIIYTKRMKDGKNRDRLECQEHLNQEHVDAIVRKLLPEGHLVNPDKVKILWCCDSKILNYRISIYSWLEPLMTSYREMRATPIKYPSCTNTDSSTTIANPLGIFDIISRVFF